MAEHTLRRDHDDSHNCLPTRKSDHAYVAPKAVKVWAAHRTNLVSKMNGVHGGKYSTILKHGIGLKRRRSVAVRANCMKRTTSNKRASNAAVVAEGDILPSSSGTDTISDQNHTLHDEKLEVKPKSKNSITRRPRSRKAASRTRSRKKTVDLDSDEEKIKKRFVKKEGNVSHTAAAKPPVVRQLTGRSHADEEFTVCNPEGYKRIVCKLDETRAARLKRQIPKESVFQPTNWVCAFCLRGSHQSGLGDLFGPYYVLVPRDGLDLPAGLFTVALSKRKRPSKKTNANSEEAGASSPPRRRKKNKDERVVHVENAHGIDHCEVWVHAPCVLWTPDLYFISLNFVGLDVALTRAWSKPCWKCQALGASMKCVANGCQRHVHYPCAVDSGCVLKDQEQGALCSEHHEFARRNFRI